MEENKHVDFDYRSLGVWQHGTSERAGGNYSYLFRQIHGMYPRHAITAPI